MFLIYFKLKNITLHLIKFSIFNFLNYVYSGFLIGNNSFKIPLFQKSIYAEIAIVSNNTEFTCSLSGDILNKILKNGHLPTN